MELFSLEIFHSETIVGILKSCEDLERIMQKVAILLTQTRCSVVHVHAYNCAT